MLYKNLFTIYNQYPNILKEDFMKKQYLIILLCLFFWSCMAASRNIYNVNINGFADKSFDKINGCKLYVLENKNAVNSILDREIADKIKKVLINEGYIISKPKDADFFISFNYGISSHKKTLTFKQREPGHFEQKSRVFAYNITQGTEYK